MIVKCNKDYNCKLELRGSGTGREGVKEMIEKHGLAPRLSISLLDGSEWILLRHMGQLNRTN